MVERTLFWLNRHRNLFVASLIAIIMLLLANTLRERVPIAEYILNGIAVGLITAVVLGATLEYTMMTRLARNAFEAALGYVLPDRLKPELVSIYNIRVLCSRHDQTVELKRMDDSVEMRVEIRRTFTNIGDKIQELPIRLAIDEWFNEHGQSRIVRLGYSTGTDRFDLVGEDSAHHGVTIRQENSILIAEAKHITLRPGEEIMTWSEFVEMKRVNDVLYMFFTVPTDRPRGTLRIVDGSNQMGWTVGFAHRKADEVAHPGPQTYELPAMLLVHQPIEVRWWDKDDLARWQLPGRNSD